jgi:S-adenosylmethionine:tRNA ribosyltransferase-isomerase
MRNIEMRPNFEMNAFDYQLPAEQIAEKPLPERDLSKLLIWKNGEISHDQYLNLSKHLPDYAHLVFNNTRVIAARLLFKKHTGGEIEIFLLEPHDGSYTALHDTGSSKWNCMIGGLKKWKHDETLTLHFTVDENIDSLKATCVDRKEDHCIIAFDWESNLAFHEVLEQAGKVPLPPYIKRMADETDKTRYQTVYAKEEGSVAAPTAGLHFTERIFKSLETKSITHSFVTLHVGAGTFKPVSTASIADHPMHEEFFELDLKMIEALCDDSKMIIAVGTTSARTLESLYWIAWRLMSTNKDLHFYDLEQWEYLDLIRDEMPNHVIVFRYLADWMREKNMNSIKGFTGICITPSYDFRVCRGLITNFHQPQSTLLLLIAAIMKDDWKRTYDIAIQEKYRFLSYGDGSLLFL